MSQTNENAFESYVEEILLTRSGWHAGSRADWDKECALFPAQVYAFLQATQPELWAEMKALHADGLETLLLNSLVKELEIKGALHVLRHGFKFYGKRKKSDKPGNGRPKLPNAATPSSWTKRIPARLAKPRAN